MFVRQVHTNGRRYLQLVESFRPPGGGLPRPRVLAHLGSVEKLRAEGGLDRLIRSLSRFSSTLCYGPGQLQHEEAFDYGNVWLLERLWHELGLQDVLGRWLARPRRRDTLAHVKTLVFNRCMDPKSRLAVMEWLPRQKIPGVDPGQIGYMRLLRSLAYLVRAKERIEQELSSRLLTLFDTDLGLALYDLTSSYFEGVCCRLAAHGHTREHRPDKKQIVVGLVTTREGLPVRHQVFTGNTADRATVRQQVQELRRQHPISQVRLVGDRGMISRKNLFWILQEEWEAILGMSLTQARPYLKEAFSRAGPKPVELEDDLKVYELRAEEVVHNGQKGKQRQSKRVETRVLVCVNEQKRREDAAFRDQQVEKALREFRRIRYLIGEGQIGSRDEVLTRISGVVARHKVKKWIESEVPKKNWKKFTWRRKVPKGGFLQEDGVWVLQTTDLVLPIPEVVRAYKNLQVVERGFRTLKCAICLRPIFVRNEEHVPGHVFVAVLAYLLHRAIELRLRGPRGGQEAHRALEALAQIKLVRSRVGKTTLWGATRPNALAAQMLEALGMGNPPRVVVEGKPAKRSGAVASADSALFPLV